MSRVQTLQCRAVWVVLAALVLSLAVSVGANGRKGAKKEYRAMAGEVAFSAELEPILFQLQTVDNRYRVMRIRIVNNGAANLALSRQADAVSVVTEAGEVSGILDLGARDAALWDRYDAALRGLLAYPTQVGRREEESVFVFLPAEQVKAAPIMLQYRIAALREPVILRTPVAAAD